MDQTQEKKFAKTLSSPEMIKSVTRTLTPPISPFHKADNLRAERVSPPSSSASTSSNVPISDPFIDANWPGRPKRNSFGEEIAKPSLPKTRQVSTPSPGTASKPPIFPTSPKVIGKILSGFDRPNKKNIVHFLKGKDASILTFLSLMALLNIGKKVHF